MSLCPDVLTSAVESCNSANTADQTWPRTCRKRRFPLYVSILHQSGTNLATFWSMDACLGSMPPCQVSMRDVSMNVSAPPDYRPILCFFVRVRILDQFGCNLKVIYSIFACSLNKSRCNYFTMVAEQFLYASYTKVEAIY